MHPLLALAPFLLSISVLPPNAPLPSSLGTHIQGCPATLKLSTQGLHPGASASLMTAVSLPSSPSDGQPESYPAAACPMQDKPVLVLPLDTSSLICKPNIGSELFFYSAFV